MEGYFLIRGVQYIQGFCEKGLVFLWEICGRLIIDEKCWLDIIAVYQRK